MLGAVIAGVIYFFFDSQPSPMPDTPLPTADIAQLDGDFEELDEPMPFETTETLTVEEIATEVPSSPLLASTLPESAIFIPSAGIYAPIVQAYLDGVSWDVSQLGTNVGHLQGTSWVGASGNVVLSGHVELSDGRQGAFANLGSVVEGDVIVVMVGEEQWRYVITEIGVTTPSDLTPVYPTQDDRLTLITCDDYDFFSNVYRERVIIVAQRIT